MDLGRALKFINLSIAVLVVLGLGGVYWFAYRPLPKTSGDIIAPISAQASVERDALGVPHISAAKWEDAIFLQGYVTAQDHLWQMDALRRLAARRIVRSVGIVDAGVRPGSAAPPFAPGGRTARPHVNCRGSRLDGGLRPRSELLHGNAARKASAGVHRAALRSAALDASRTASCAASRCIAS